MSWWFERRALRRNPAAEIGATPIAAGDDPTSFSIAEFEAGLDLETERKRARRDETLLFLRAILILILVIAVVVLRQLALV